MTEANINMKADDSAMVDDILNELNQTSNDNLEDLMKEDDLSNVDNMLSEMNEGDFSQSNDNLSKSHSLPDSTIENIPQIPVVPPVPTLNSVNTTLSNTQINTPIQIQTSQGEVTSHPQYQKESDLVNPPIIKKMEHTSEPVVDVVYQKNDSKINTIINTMKKPLIVIGLSFIIFHPYTSKLLAKIFPKIFNSNTFIASNLRLICLSLILGLVFLAINTIM